MTEKRPTRRRWFRFSLRTFLVVSLLIGFGFAWVGMQLQQKRRHEAVVKEVVKLGGRVHFQYRGEVLIWGEWLFGSCAVKPIVLDLTNTDATDSLLSQTQGMNLFSLGLNSSKVTDAGLIHLEGMNSLHSLYLINTQITDAGLTHLEGMASLEFLYLHNTQTTDAGIAKLKKAIPRCRISH